MFLKLIKFELKNILRNQMTVLTLGFPLIIGIIGRILLEQKAVEGDALGITALTLAILTGYMYGAVAGFSILDDRDDQVFASIQISPISLQGYIWFKVIFVYIITVLAGFFILWFTKAVALAWGDILLVSVLCAMQMPINAFLINAVAKNKVEGFVSMKATGFLMVFPIAAYFFLDAKEWLFSFAPGHWAAKAVQYAFLKPAIDAGQISMNLDFYGYIVIGLVYNVILIALTYALFKRKNNI